MPKNVKVEEVERYGKTWYVLMIDDEPYGKVTKHTVINTETGKNRIVKTTADVPSIPLADNEELGPTRECCKLYGNEEAAWRAFQRLSDPSRTPVAPVKART